MNMCNTFNVLSTSYFASPDRSASRKLITVDVSACSSSLCMSSNAAACMQFFLLQVGESGSCRFGRHYEILPTKEENVSIRKDNAYRAHT